MELSFSEIGKVWEEQVWGENQEFSFGSGEAEIHVSVHRDDVVSEAACLVPVSHKTRSSEGASTCSVLLTTLAPVPGM